MIYNIAYILLAALALGFLIFIHELGHYFIARREGMIVEVFAIGFGRPIFSWNHKGVRWQVCWLPFGGYVKIAGMEKKGDLEPYQIPGGFFSKTPASRIRVALAGPVVNIFTSFLIFAVIWFTGGRQRPYSEYAHLIGWVDSSSQVYDLGIRPGDEIERIGMRPFTNFNDLVYSAFLDASDPKLSGFTIDYETGIKKPFNFTLDAGRNLKGAAKARATVGLLSPASYLIYDPMGGSNPIAGSPLKDASLEKNDRIIWVDGELVFSQRQLVSIINEPSCLVSCMRDQKLILSKVPRLSVADLRTSTIQKTEIDDWLFAAGVSKQGIAYFIPYNLTADGLVESPLPYIDENLQQITHEGSATSSLDKQLMPGDRIVAIDGIAVTSSVDIARLLQKRHIQMIVQRGADFAPISSKLADSAFFQGVDFSSLKNLVSSIGAQTRKVCDSNLCLLKPIEPKTLDEYPLPEDKRTELAEDYATQKKQIEAIKDPQQRQEAMRLLQKHQSMLVLGIQLQDRFVIYNPTPMRLFFSACDETWRTIKALFTGYLSPKYMSGPVGIVQAIHHGWSLGINEALYWIAIISLNLGILNLLPIPVLDGGHICLSVYEAATKKRIKAKTMERLIIPFIVLMLLFFVYATYNDILRLISKFF